MLDSDSTQPFYPGLDGQPLQSGKVYFGASGQNPVTSPITVYWDQAGTQPAKQPVDVINGRTVRNGNPSRVWTNGDYSRMVIDGAGRQVVYEATQPGSATLLSKLSASDGASNVGFSRAGADGLSRTLLDKSRDIVSIKDTVGVTGNAGEDQGAGLNKAIAAAAARGLCDLIIPDGTYDTTVPIIHLPGVTLRFSKNAQIRATAAMAALVQGSAAQMIYECGVYGGRLLCNNLADAGYDPQFFQHLTIDSLTIEDFLSVACRLGLAGTPTSSYEPIVRNLRTFRGAGAVQAGSIALHVRAATDGMFSECVVQGAENGVKCETADNHFNLMHAWTRNTTGALKIGFWDVGFGNTYAQCTADTPTQYGWRLEGRRYALASNYTLNSTFGGLDNVMTAVLLTSTDPQASVIGHITEGIDGTHRVLLDIDFSAVDMSLDSLWLEGNTARKNVTNIAPAIMPNVGTRVMRLLDSTGVSRVELTVDAGGNYSMKRRDATGALLGTPVLVTNASGQVSMTDAGLTLAGTFNKPLTMNGVNNLWVDATGRLRIKAGVPTGDTDGTVVGTQA